MGTLHEDQYIFLTIYRSVLRMRNISEESCKENQNTHFIFNIYIFFFKSFRFLRWC